ncbi:MAG: acyl-CoA dehydrogenase family protein [Gammaproteobacteria bacterium]|nr:acyl-CoA dehydrogenase family protein [Gammaproteobacteria bacterium]
MSEDNGLNADLYNLTMSEEAKPLLDAVTKHIAEHVDPIVEEFYRLGEGREDRWSWAPGQLELLEGAKNKAKESGLWNFFLPDADTGEGLKNLDYAYIAAELGKCPLASESLNCSAPDTGNMEVLERVGTPEQKEQWLKPLLNGEIRSAYAMTEPNLASSDAKNIGTRAVLENGEWVINGEKFYISGAGDPRCKIMITMVKTSPDAAPHRQQSQILVPIDAPGVHILEGMEVFGHDDAPHGHMHIKFDNVRVPEGNILLGEGRGFEISQVRLGPGRIHHCMRSIGQAEKALDLMVRRGLSREAFGKPIAQLGKNVEVISRARIDIEAMRLMVLQAAKAMDVLGNQEARIWVHMVKAMVPERVCQIIDQAIQIHGATGVSQWTPLAGMYTGQRTLRLADGPDEVHHLVVGRAELRKYGGSA